MAVSPAPRPARLAVGVVGFGRVGAALAVAMQRAGHTVVAVSGASEPTRRRAAQVLPDVPVLPAEDVVRRAEAVLLTVPDDALQGVVETLSAQGAFSPGQLVVHTSGRHGLAVLADASAAGAVTLALHPVMSFSGTAEDPDRLPGASWGVTVDPALRAVAEVLVMELGGEPVWVPEEARVVYHAALAWSASYAVTLVTTAVDLLAAAGVEAPARILGPLVGASLDNALRYGDAGLTGPIARGDAGTVRAHLDALRQVAPDALPAYVALARLTADRALSSGRLEPALAASLLEVLANPRADARP
ncbi:MAG TPA: DUF2520 domain-containing protein [Mycobacteriales bacterium]|nr:DUF2520 domain-containing protein [Mycobacteriales bacterium]